MAGIFGGNVSWIPGVDDFKVNYILEGDEAASVFQREVGDSSYVFLGDRNGTDYITKARTFEWGINSIQPDGQIAAAGNMQLPIRWGQNGQVLGVTAGAVDWITPSDVSNLSVSISQFDCTAVTNRDLVGESNYGGVADVANPEARLDVSNLENMQNHYDNFHYVEDDEFGERVAFAGIAGDEIRLSTSLGLFSKAKAVSSMALGWQNTTSLPYSTLIGSNLDLSGHPYYSEQTDFSYGEVVIGTSNKKYEMRPPGKKQRILTIGCGDLSNNSGNPARDDAMFILKDGTSHFTKDVDISGTLNVLKNIRSSGNIEMHGGDGSNKFYSDLLIKNSAEDTKITLDSLYGDIDASGEILAEGGIRTNTLRPISDGDDISFSGGTTAVAYIHNFAKMHFYTGNTLSNNDTIIHHRGISSEDISCSRITIGGLHFPPKTNTERNIDSLGKETGSGGSDTKFVLSADGNGTVMWRDLSSVAIDVSLSQLSDTLFTSREGNQYLLLASNNSNTGTLDDVSGIMVKNLWISNGGDVSNALIEGSIDICKNVLIQGHLEVSGNTDICGNVDICGGVIIAGDVDISENVKIYGGVDISKNVIIDGHVDISENVIIHGGVDINKNVVIDGTADICGNVDISGDVQINGRADISKNVIIGGNVDISGTTYLNDDVRIGTIAEPAVLGVTGNVDISGTLKISNDIEVSGNFFFSKDATRRVQTLDYEDKRLSILGLIKNEVATAIGQSIKTPAGGLMWFAREKAPDNFRVCNGQFFKKTHSLDLRENLANSIAEPWNHEYNGMDEAEWKNKYLINQVIDISQTSATPTFNINVMNSLSRNRLVGDIASIAQSQDISLTFFTTNMDSDICLNFNIRATEDISINLTTSATPPLKEQALPLTTDRRVMNFSLDTFKTSVAASELLNLGISYGGVSHDLSFNMMSLDEAVFHEQYVQLPDLMDKFIRGVDGVDISIGRVETEKLRDHKHISTDHQHDLENIVVDFSHNHDLSYDMHDMSINHHDHSIAMGYVNYSSVVIAKNLSSHVQIDPITNIASAGQNTSDISLLIHPDSIIRHSLTDAQRASTDYTVLSMTASDQGGGELTIAGHTKTVESPDILGIPSDTNMQGNYKFISISGDGFGYDTGKHEYTFPENTLTDASRSYVENACDIIGGSYSNPTHDDIRDEGYPTHLVMLPCISIGIVQGSTDEGVFDYESYSYQNRIRYLENRLDKMDKLMNTTAINIIGPLTYIQKVTNAPSVWEEPTRGAIYESFNYTGFIFNYDDSGNKFYFDFTESTYNLNPPHHRVLHKGVYYDISSSNPSSELDIDTWDDTTSNTFSDTYKVLSVDGDVTIQRYYDTTDISWSFTNPKRK